jgi:negative regulator of flagellin synthesis FlgM
LYEAIYYVVLECQMRVNSPPDIPFAASTQTQAAASKAVQEPDAKAVKDANSSGVAVTVSNLARSLEAANKGEPADVDTEKVNAIRSKIEQGTYTVNAKAIADKLLSNAREFLERNRG